jgi:hypothetical protein
MRSIRVLEAAFASGERNRKRAFRLKFGETGPCGRAGGSAA